MTKFGTVIDTLLSDARVANLIKYSTLSAGPGYIAEFGVFRGGSLEILAKYNPGRDIIAVDSFQGVPPASEHDYHQEGDFSSGVDVRNIIGYFSMMYPSVRIVKGFIPKVFDFFDNHSRFSFVHIDLDMYESIYQTLDFVLPRTNDGGIILLDDYKINSTPGCKKAIDEFFEKTDFQVKHRQELKFWDAEDAPTVNQYLIIK